MPSPVRFLTALILLAPLAASAQEAHEHDCGAHAAEMVDPHAFESGASYACDPATCVPPACQCAATTPPHGLQPAQIPHFVLLTYDDCVDWNAQQYIAPIHQGLYNPDGRPIPATYFVSVENCWQSHGVPADPQLVNQLYLAGHEMANHSLTHTTSNDTPVGVWAHEILGAMQFLAGPGGVALEHIRGFRAPYVATTEGMFKTLRQLGYLYDSSLMEQPLWNASMSNGQSGYVWPHTMDHGAAVSCGFFPGNRCPEAPVPGVWQIPVYFYTHPAGEMAPPSQMYYGGFDPGSGTSGGPELTGQALLGILRYNFLARYQGNRVPINLFLHASQLTTPARRAAMNEFLHDMLGHPNVWAVTMTGLIEWMKNPAPASQMTEWYADYCTRFPCSGRLSSEAVTPAVFGASVFPNPAPANATLRVELDRPGPVRVEVYDLLGRLVYREESERGVGTAAFLLPLHDLAPGTYQYVVTASGRTLRGRVTRV